ncbi:MAG: beta-eliminating lyase-related protein [Chitinophagaceae bacterium]|nr:beta-eliminating lyase-related protein [Chitinophagaceae bacterium]
MNNLQRRNFLKLAATSALIPATGLPAFAFKNKAADKKTVADFRGDGLNHSPAEYANLLARLTETGSIMPDNYSIGGCVEELEIKFAKLLGKETAVFMPTGTLANHLAIRSLSGNNKRVIVQQESHVYNDTGDGTQVLSNLNLIPVGTNKASFTVEEVDSVVKKSESGRVAAKVGVISIESPVRRKQGEVFEYEQMKQIAAYAKANDIKMHLDGARIFLATPYTGVTVTEYASLFDTIYVSLYKYFNAASGAILAGPKSIIAPMYQNRRMFGSGLNQAWPFTAVANYYLDGFAERFVKAVAVSEDLIKKLSTNSRFEIHRIASGTNIFRLTVKGMEAKTFVENLKSKNVIARAGGPTPNDLILQVNESLLHSSAAELESIFVKSLS